MRYKRCAFFLPLAIVIAAAAPAGRAQLLDIKAAPAYHSQLAAVIGPAPLAAVDPVPEPRTAAVALCGLFVAGLIGRHLYRRRLHPVTEI
jgi:hypothetical protein